MNHIHSNDSRLKRMDAIISNHRRRRKIAGLTLCCTVSISGLCIAGAEAPTILWQLASCLAGLSLFVAGGYGIRKINGGKR